MNKNLDLVRVRMVKEASVPYGYANSPDTAIDAMRDFIADFAQETVCAIFIDTKCRVLSASMISFGSIDQSFVSPREVIQAALLANASKIILMHNHPSGDPTPSAADYLITEKLFNACQLMDLELVDHIVVGEGAYYSFQEQGAIRELKTKGENT